MVVHLNLSFNAAKYGYIKCIYYSLFNCFSISRCLCLFIFFFCCHKVYVLEHAHRYKQVDTKEIGITESK